ncbi:MAG: phosphorylase [Nitrospiraceae bacterium]|nr:MAG: phosphorylase [Nitrospiraceae bacterium]
MWTPGRLWSSIVSSTQHALKTGALMPISTETSWITDSGIDFQIRVVSSLRHKREAGKREEDKASAGQKRPNPFLPYEKDMFVSDITPSHLCLLNKFNVIDYHLLIVTREFEDQEMLLTLRDFEAVWMCMAEFEGLAFYNGGVVAGASQPHKHLQMVPLPIGDRGCSLPIDPLIRSSQADGLLRYSRELPFIHSIAFLDRSIAGYPGDAAEVTHQLYRMMLKKTGLNEVAQLTEEKQSGPYNLLFTRDWMLLVKRSTEFFGTISVNALGFAGGLLARDDQEMKLIRDSGPMTILRHTAAAD